MFSFHGQHGNFQLLSDFLVWVSVSEVDPEKKGRKKCIVSWLDKELESMDSDCRQFQ